MDDIGARRVRLAQQAAREGERNDERPVLHPRPDAGARRLQFPLPLAMTAANPGGDASRCCSMTPRHRPPGGKEVTDKPRPASKSTSGTGEAAPATEEPGGKPVGEATQGNTGGDTGNASGDDDNADAPWPPPGLSMITPAVATPAPATTTETPPVAVGALQPRRQHLSKPPPSSPPKRQRLPRRRPCRPPLPRQQHRHPRRCPAPWQTHPRRQPLPQPARKPPYPLRCCPPARRHGQHRQRHPNHRATVLRPPAARDVGAGRAQRTGVSVHRRTWPRQSPLMRRISTKPSASRRAGWPNRRSASLPHPRDPERPGPWKYACNWMATVSTPASPAPMPTSAALENSLPKLREMLGEQGLQLAHADVGQHSDPRASDGSAHAGGTAMHAMSARTPCHACSHRTHPAPARPARRLRLSLLSALEREHAGCAMMPFWQSFIARTTCSCMTVLPEYTALRPHAAVSGAFIAGGMGTCIASFERTSGEYDCMQPPTKAARAIAARTKTRTARPSRSARC